MAYCVNCGVELSATEKKCPLCGRPSDAPSEEITERAYPAAVQKKKISAWNVVILGVLLMLIPAIICLMCDLFSDFKISWSLYVLGGELVAYTFITLPVVLKSPKSLACISADVSVTGLYLTLIAYLTGNMAWLLPLGIPAAFLVGAAVFGLIKMSKTRLAPLHKFAIGAVALSAVSITADMLSRNYLFHSFFPRWTLCGLGPVLIIAGALLYIEHNKDIKDKIVRRTFI